MNKLIVQFVVVIMAQAISFSAAAAEGSCKHLFHNHEIDSLRIKFMLSEPNKQREFINAVLGADNVPSSLEVTKLKKSVEFSYFEQKTLINPIYDMIYGRIGFFPENRIRYSVIKDMNGEIWAIHVSFQASPNVVKDLAIFTVDHTPGKSKKGPVLIKSFQDNSVL